MHYRALVDPNASAMSSAIGARVRHERQARRWTLDRLAEVAGLSRRMLVNVEHGAANPSVGTLLRISTALGVGLPALVEPARAGPVRVTRRGEGATRWRGEAGGRGVLVAGTEPPDVVELWDWTLGPGDRHAADTHAPGAKELLQVHRGAVTVDVEDRSVVLGAGDSIAYPGDVAHAYANHEKRPAHFTLAVIEPGARAGSAS